MSLRKARAKQVEQDDKQTQGEPKKAVTLSGKDVSKRELVRQGEYVQLAALVPKDLVKRLKLMAIEEDDGRDLSDHVAAALSLYLDSLSEQ